MELDESVLEALQEIGDCGSFQHREIEEALFIAACIALDSALERDASSQEMARHCREVLRLGERVCNRKSIISITPRLFGIYVGLRRQAERGGLPDSP